MHFTLCCVVDDTLVRFHGGGTAGVSTCIIAEISVVPTQHTTGSVFVAEDVARQIVPSSRFTVLFDAGALAIHPPFVKRDKSMIVLLSHLHGDHCSGLHAIVSTRARVSLDTHICAPHTTEADSVLESVLLAQEGMENNCRARENFQERPPKERFLRYLVHLHRADVPATNNTNQDHNDDNNINNNINNTQNGVIAPLLPLPPKHSVHAFPTRHRVPSVGYAVVHTTRKLRAEFAHLTSQQIAQLAQSASPDKPAELFEERRTVQIVYSGDTTIDFLDDPTAGDFVQHARVLVLECTFLPSSTDNKEKAKRSGHIHLLDIVDRAEDFRGVGALVLTHFSSRYSQQQILESLDNNLPQWLRQKTTVHTISSLHSM